MKVVFAPQAATDLEQIERAPESAQRLVQRPNVRVVPLLRYPYMIFYRMNGDRIDILHIRHTSRRAWENAF
ncbi:MAG TPA: hypothetical protein VH020_05460 [Stellaceae bacterium]|jgi:plasmid stabilization system protein ParE|nr:hypothetical protein [Stellaceae bacterium]